MIRIFLLSSFTSFALAALAVLRSERPDLTEILTLAMALLSSAALWALVSIGGRQGWIPSFRFLIKVLRNRGLFRPRLSKPQPAEALMPELMEAPRLTVADGDPAGRGRKTLNLLAYVHLRNIYRSTGAGRVARQLIEHLALRGDVDLHLVADPADHVRIIAVIPNGVDMPATASAELFLDRFPALREKRLVLLLGRIHFKKGLDILAEAWADVSSQFPEAQLVLVGPDFENTRSEIEKRLDDLGVRERVTFTGMLPSDLKWSALAAADFFVLPSYSEGLSVSVLEAMGMAKPVVITKQYNLPEVAEFECGWTIDPRAGQLASALRGLLRSTDRERSSFGNNGRHLVAERYSWPVIGEQMAALYDWLEGGPLPFRIQPASWSEGMNHVRLREFDNAWTSPAGPVCGRLPGSFSACPCCAARFCPPRDFGFAY